MAPPKDLREIGLEGFDLINKFYGPQRRSIPAAQQGRPGFQGPKHEVANNEAGKPRPQYRCVWKSSETSPIIYEVIRS